MIAMLADLLNNIGKLVGILSEQQEQRTIQFDRLFQVLDKLIELNKREGEKWLSLTISPEKLSIVRYIEWMHWYTDITIKEMAGYH
jgi:hypothetical protein